MHRCLDPLIDPVQNCLNFKSFAGSRHFIDEFSLGRVGEDLIGIKSTHASIH